MKWKNRLTNYNFWISIISAVLLILQAFKINFDIAYINEIATAVLGLLVVIGIISDPTKTAVSTSTEPKINKEETAVKEEESKPETVEEIPTDKQDEIDYANIQNDFKVLVEQISRDLEKMTRENASVMNELKSIKISQDEKEETNIEPVTTDAVESNQTSYNIVNQ